MTIARPAAALLGLAFCFAASAAAAQDIALTGLTGAPVALTPADVAALPHVTLTVTVEGKTTTYQGVPLTDVLARLGAPTGKALRGKDLADVVLVTGRDGYAAALALADTDSLMRKEQVLLADKADGAPLPDALGPYRLVVEGDQRGARDVRMVAAISLRQLAAPAAK